MASSCGTRHPSVLLASTREEQSSAIEVNVVRCVYHSVYTAGCAVAPETCIVCMRKGVEGGACRSHGTRRSHVCGRELAG